MERKPPTAYRENADLIHYERRDGQRILCIQDALWSDEEMMQNCLRDYHNRQFIDYLIVVGSAALVDKIAHRWAIPLLDFPDIQQALRNGFPTHALFFTEDIDNVWTDYRAVAERGLTFEIVHH